MNILGIGGIFFKSKKPDELKNWYQDHLGLENMFSWNDLHQQGRVTIWNVHAPQSEIFNGTDKDYVINYIVDSLKDFVETLKPKGLLSNKIDKDEHGSFAYVADPEGNKIVLWEPSQSFPPKVSQKEKVTGLGGVFFRSSDPKNLNNWYKENLTIPASEWGATFQWHDQNNPNEKVPATTVWNPFAADTKYFDPSKSQFMINYRVKDIAKLMKDLGDAGVQIAGKIEEHSYGKFGWIVDPDGNKIELWEPIDDGF